MVVAVCVEHVHLVKTMILKKEGAGHQQRMTRQRPPHDRERDAERGGDGTGIGIERVDKLRYRDENNTKTTRGYIGIAPLFQERDPPDHRPEGYRCIAFICIYLHLVACGGGRGRP